MKKIAFHTTSKIALADLHTPVGIYLRLRDRYRDTILLESTDYHAAENSRSIIAVNAIAGIEVRDIAKVEYKYPTRKPESAAINATDKLTTVLKKFFDGFEPAAVENRSLHLAQGFFGYNSYDAIPFFENITINTTPDENSIPLLRYRMYQYVIIIDHYKDEMLICENHFDGIDSNLAILESYIHGKDAPVFPFECRGEEESNMDDESYRSMVKKGVASCHRGDVFQVVLSRRFSQQFYGDDFNVYRALRSVNPSPYLFYFDYGDYKLIGSSPESQVIIQNGEAIVHPIAGTFKRTGNDDIDKEKAQELRVDPKENAEHVMLVDLARNDLSRVSDNVSVTDFKKIQFYSHVIHLVSEVRGKLPADSFAFEVMGQCFPAGTLSGAPKYKAMQIIADTEPTARGFYGGAIGFMGLDGSCNHAIMIRTFLSKGNRLIYQAGAGVVAASEPESELQEVNNKLGALKKAIVIACNLTPKHSNS